MDTRPQPFKPMSPEQAQAVDDLLASPANLTERPFGEIPVEVDDDDWRERTQEYDARAFAFGQHPVGSRDARSTRQMLADARFGLDVFLNEASVALMVGHSDMTDEQRAHLTKIVTFIEALGDRFDRVTRK